jgi:hypothetical protein
MDILGSYREFRRKQDGLLIWLRLEEWPLDVPLPTGTQVAKTGDGPFDPCWRFVLEPDKTIEAVVGWFILPLSLQGAMEWYQTEMTKRGWEELAKGSYRLPRSAAVRFQQPDSKARVTVGMWHGKDAEHTDAMIRRITEHPWAPPTADPTRTLRRGADAKRCTAAPSKRRRQAKGRARVVA